MLSRYQMECDSSAMETSIDSNVEHKVLRHLTPSVSFSLALRPRVAIKCDYFGAELLLALAVCAKDREHSFAHRCIRALVSQPQIHSSSMTPCKHEIFPILFAIVILLERYTIISHLNECMSPTAAINNKRTSIEMKTERKKTPSRTEDNNADRNVLTHLKAERNEEKKNNVSCLVTGSSQLSCPKTIILFNYFKFYR